MVFGVESTALVQVYGLRKDMWVEDRHVCEFWRFKVRFKGCIEIEAMCDAHFVVIHGKGDTIGWEKVRFE